MRRKPQKHGIKSLCDNILSLVEARFYYDAFVLTNKADAIGVHVHP